MPRVWNGAKAAQLRSDYQAAARARRALERKLRKSKGKRKKFTPRTKYDLYLASPAWQAKRQEAFKFYGRKCNKCGRTKNLQVHHKTYLHIGFEKMEDLEILCRPCHQSYHDKNPKE